MSNRTRWRAVLIPRSLFSRTRWLSTNNSLSLITIDQLAPDLDQCQVSNLFISPAINLSLERKFQFFLHDNMAVLVSIAIIFGTLLTGDIVRNFLVIPKLQDGSLTKKLLLDAILAIELCASSFEIGVIFQHYGMVVWTFCVFLSTVYQLTRWRGLAMPSPNTHILDWVLGIQSLKESLLRNFILVAVGLIAHR